MQGPQRLRGGAVLRTLEADRRCWPREGGSGPVLDAHPTSQLVSRRVGSSSEGAMLERTWFDEDKPALEALDQRSGIVISRRT
jgi:hypothetical protein